MQSSLRSLVPVPRGVIAGSVTLSLPLVSTTACVPRRPQEEECAVSSDIGMGEDELLRSIEEVEDRIKVFRKKVRAVLASVQPDGGDKLHEPKV